MNKSFPVPPHLKHPLFYPDESISITNRRIDQICVTEPFVHELAYYLDMDTIKPWEEQEESIKAILSEWHVIKDKLEKVFAAREKNKTLPLMKSGIALLIQFLFWGNGLPSVMTKDFSSQELSVKPVNTEERVNFVISRPQLYHSFIQLSELMHEQEKLYYKNLAMKRTK